MKYSKSFKKDIFTNSKIFGLEITPWLVRQLALVGVTTFPICCADGETELTVDQRLLTLEEDSTSVGEDLAGLATRDGSYEEYLVLVAQTSTSAPTAKVINNSLGGTPTFGYTSAGLYTLTNTGAFTADKTTIELSNAVADTTTFAVWTSANVITFGSNVANTGVATNAKLTDNTFRIRVYA